MSTPSVHPGGVAAAPVRGLASRRRRPGRPAFGWPERIALAVVVLAVFVAVFGPLLAPLDPYRVAQSDAFQPPGPGHWLGTDALGRDVGSRLLAGAQTTLLSAFVVVAVAAVVGTAVGTAAAVAGGWVEEVLMRICDVALSLPSIVLALGLAAVLGADTRSAVIALCLTWWPGYARLVRGVVRETLHSDFVAAARVLGVRTPRLVGRHLLPNSLDTLYVQTTLDVAAVTLVVSGLSFVGVGAQPPSAEWGAMIAESRGYVTTAWWTVALPGAAVAVVAIAFQLVGDAVRVRNDPTLRAR